MGTGYPEGRVVRSGRDWTRDQVCRHGNFALVVVEQFTAAADDISYTRQEDYLKFAFWLTGRHTTVLDGFGQHDHERPEVFITAGPPDMVKVDVLNQGSPSAAVCVCVRRDFFKTYMGLELDELPQILQVILHPTEFPYTFHQHPLNSELVAASRAVLATPAAVRCDPLYIQAKCIELLCLLINSMKTVKRRSEKSAAEGRREARLYQARELLTLRYAEPVSLQGLSREVGLNRVSLSVGFRQLFGITAYEYLQKQRMERAYELLQEQESSVSQIAAAVGFGHSCNFSTAFHAYFGCTPQQARSRRR